MIKKTPTKKTEAEVEVKTEAVVAAETPKTEAVAKKATKVVKKTKKTIKEAKKAEAAEAKAEVAVVEGEAAADGTQEAVKVAKVIKVRGAKYQAVRAKLDKSQILEPKAAVELVKKMSYSKFAGALEVHVITKEVGTSVTVTLPHSTGKTVRVAIASDEVLAEVEAGKVDFDVLVSTPQFMGKLAKLARILGPKGLMPNPKNGTLTDNPERKAKELSGGALTVKTEKKAPLMHLSIGKLSMDSKDLTENLVALLKALRGKIDKVTICATMSPSVKVMVEQVVTA
jgi:large subunit ribosomal protein L1